MRKILLIGFLISSCSLFSFAQVSAGPKFGLNFSTVKGGTKDYANKMIAGFHGGAYINYQISSLLSIELQSLYTRKGFRSDLMAVGQDTNIKRTLSYIDFPLLLNIWIMDNASINFGPQIGYIINAHTKGKISSSSTSTVENINENTVYGYHTTEYSFAAGGSYVFNFGLKASLGFSYGITKLYDNGAFSHNMVFQLSLGYVFGTRGAGGAGTGTIYNKL